MNRRIIIFDLDLTLIQTREIHIQGIVSCFQTCLGITPDLSVFDEASGMPFDELLSVIHTRTTSSPLVTSHLRQLRKEFAVFYREHIADLVKPFPRIPEVLALLQERHCHLALFSSKRRSIAEQELHETGLSVFFPITIFRDDVAQPKPAPEGIFRVLQAASLDLVDAGRAARVVMVGDAVEDIQCARNAGIRSVLAAWKWHGHHPYLPVEADFTAYTPDDLLTFFSSLPC